MKTPQIYRLESDESEIKVKAVLILALIVIAVVMSFFYTFYVAPIAIQKAEATFLAPTATYTGLNQ